MVYASKYDAYGYEKCLYLLVYTLKKLETERLTINKGQQVQLYFVLGVIIGDNLGLNGILGFSRCFRANFYCRFCKHSRSECHVTTRECENVLRTKETHVADLLHPFADNGLQEDSILNTIPSFPVVENYSVDLMHGILDGVASYDLTEILIHFLKFTTLHSKKSRVDSTRTAVGFVCGSACRFDQHASVSNQHACVSNQHACVTHSIHNSQFRTPTVD
jgi:hypothetical protein